MNLNLILPLFGPQVHQDLIRCRLFIQIPGKIYFVGQLSEWRCVDDISVLIGCKFDFHPISEIRHKFLKERGISSKATGGHLIIGRTQLSDAASFRALQTRICEI